MKGSKEHAKSLKRPGGNKNGQQLKFKY